MQHEKPQCRRSRITLGQGRRIVPDRQGKTGQGYTRSHPLVHLLDFPMGIVLADGEGEVGEQICLSLPRPITLVTVQRGRDFEEVSPTSHISAVIAHASSGALVAQLGNRGS
jgi:hypothetical protein